MADDFKRDIEAVARIDAIPAILEVICRTTGMGFAAVARVTEDRWVACAVRDEIAFGLKPGGELKLETTICNEIRQSGQGVIIDHIAENPAWKNHHTPAMYGFQSYISLPIVRGDKSFFGTLCAIDPKPARIERQEIVEMFRLFGELIALHLDMNERLTVSETALSDERETGELRDQFIAVLGHDLRNPLASISSGVRLLCSRVPGGDAQSILGAMQTSVDRMSELVNNLLDLARGRLAGGVPINPSQAADLARTIEQVVEESRSASPGRPIESSIALDAPVHADPARIGQLLSNLLSNALAHGDEAGLVRVAARTANGTFELSVSNTGAPIPADIRGRLFQPFFRGERDGPQQGLGLGLYIASEIARAHRGALSVESDAAETRFTFRMPTA